MLLEDYIANNIFLFILLLIPETGFETPETVWKYCIKTRNYNSVITTHGVPRSKQVLSSGTYQVEDQKILVIWQQIVSSNKLIILKQ